MVICTQNKIHEIQSIAYLVMVKDVINYLNSSNQRAITPLLLRITSKPSCMVIYAQCKFHEIPLIGH